ncbi:MAG TPA: DinB family protein [Candidatus Acidoferrum sp.]|nr:DinB family protein [Candidatus Acidoferrum sp.]
MNYYSAKELADSFRTVRKNTLVIAQEIPEEKYAFRPAPDTRSVVELLSHLALSHNFQYQIQAIERRTTLAGFDFPSMLKRIVAEEKEPRTKDQILDLLRTSGEKWAGYLLGLTEDFLAEQVQMPAGMTPPTKSRFEMVLSVKEHEMHHRGQLMLIERLIGLVPHMTREMQSRLAAAAAAKG